MAKMKYGMIFLIVMGILEWIIGLIAFYLSFVYMTELAITGSINYLGNTIFFGLLGASFFISGTIIFLKSLDFIGSA